MYKLTRPIVVLGSNAYPREVKRHHDCINLVVGLGFLIWSAILVWR